MAAEASLIMHRCLLCGNSRTDVIFSLLTEQPDDVKWFIQGKSSAELPLGRATTISWLLSHINVHTHMYNIHTYLSTLWQTLTQSCAYNFTCRYTYTHTYSETYTYIYYTFVLMIWPCKRNTVCRIHSEVEFWAHLVQYLQSHPLNLILSLCWNFPSFHFMGCLKISTHDTRIPFMLVQAFTHWKMTVIGSNVINTLKAGQTYLRPFLKCQISCIFGVMLSDRRKQGTGVSMRTALTWAPLHTCTLQASSLY